MSDLLSKFSEAIKAITPLLQSHFWSIVVFLAAFGWVLILVPDQVFIALHINSTRSTYLEMIGIATFTSTFIACFGLFYKSYAFLKEKRGNKMKTRQREHLLHSLTPMEYEYLRKFIANQSQTATFTIFDGVIAGLAEKSIVYKANSQANKAGEQDFNLYPWAYEYLSTHSEIFNKGVKSETESKQVRKKAVRRM